MNFNFDSLFLISFCCYVVYSDVVIPKTDGRSTTTTAHSLDDEEDDYDDELADDMLDTYKDSVIDLNEVFTIFLSNSSCCFVIFIFFVQFSFILVLYFEFFRDSLYPLSFIQISAVGIYNISLVFLYFWYG